MTIETPTLTVAARVWGPADGAPVLALHGWLDNAATWDGVAPLLSGLRLVCVDMPGHGLSQHVSPGQTYAFVDTVARIHEVTVALGWTKFGVLGHSLGAAVASVLAGTFPERVQRLAVVEGLGPVAEEPKHAAERLARSLTLEHEKRGRGSALYPTVEHAQRRLEIAMAGLTPQSAATLCARGVKEVEGGFTWRSDPRLRLPSRMRLTEAQVLTFLRNISCPTLVVRASDGHPFMPKAHSERLGAVPHARVVEHPGGHHLHLDTPQAVAADIQEHFAPLGGPR
ncbi:MAG: alpha/beta hydrolase [Deltaproteobacteria bacterium]|nr:alpha/beta hydrolase [Deltaproteobacteria bacterium]